MSRSFPEARSVAHKASPQKAAAASASRLRRLPRSGGESIERATSNLLPLGPRHSFADVQVHSGPAPAAAARGLGATAFTLGRHVYLGATAPSPATSEGRRLLAHELGHVHQSRPGAESADGVPVVSATPAQEADARATGDRLLTGGAVAARPSDRGTSLVLGLEQLFARMAADRVEQLMPGVGPSDAGGPEAALTYLRTLSSTEDLVDTLVELDRRNRLETLAGAITVGDRSTLAGATFAVMFLSSRHRSTPSWGVVAAQVIGSFPLADRTALLAQVLRSTGREDQIDGMTEGLAAFEASETTRASEPEEEVEPDAPPVSASVFGGVGMGPWNPGGQPIPFYLGNAAHVAIAAYYAGLHASDVAFYNFTPVSVIVAAAARMGLALGTAAATAVQLGLKPDIANLSRLHLYEIKPESLQSLGRTEAMLYQTAFAAAGLPVALGPVAEPGTAGTLPAPGGWYVFQAPEPGVITYRYRQPPRRRVRVPVPVPVPDPVRVPVPDRSLRERIAEITGLSGAALTVYIIISEGSRIVFPPRNLVPVP